MFDSILENGFTKVTNPSLKNIDRKFKLSNGQLLTGVFFKMFMNVVGPTDFLRN